jgi:hypothetical protein
MVFQVLVGIWLVLSPFALGYRQITSMTINDMILGAVVVILGLTVALTGLPKIIRHYGKGT